MGLYAYVYRTPGTDCTLNGWSSKHDVVCIVNAEGPHQPTEDRSAVVIEKHRTINAVHVVLQDHINGDHKPWTMAGGKMLHSSDSRFGELIADLLGPQHRFHGPVSI